MRLNRLGVKEENSIFYLRFSQSLLQQNLGVTCNRVLCIATFFIIIIINLHFRCIFYFLFCNGFHQCSSLGLQQVTTGLHHTLVFLVVDAIVVHAPLLLLFLGMLQLISMHDRL